MNTALATLYENLKKYRLLPVIKIEAPENAVPLARALTEGGLPVAEVTFRTTCAAEAISLIKEAFPDMIVGAGTVLSVEQVKQAVAAGAAFIVSPGFNPKVVSYCNENNIAIVPGCITPTEIEMALEFGIEVIKFFPAEAFGGIRTLKSLSAPYRTVRFVPTGGINEDNLMTYLREKCVIACGGSFMVKDSYINNKEFDTIRDLTKAAVEKIHSL